VLGASLLALAVAPASAVSWREFGPAPQLSGTGTSSVSGRVSALAYSPDIDGQGTQAFFVGAAGGGVWRSTDFESASPHWTPLTDNIGQPPQLENGAVDVGSIAVDPFHPNIIYVGTGEANFSGDSRYGAGILKSTDGGNTWALLASGYFRRQSISKIFVDPTDSSGNTLYCSMVYGAGSPSTTRGIFKSLNGGVSWGRISSVLGTGTTVTDMDYTLIPGGGGGTNTLVIYAGVRDSGVWRSADGGATWTKWTGGPATVGRVSLAADHTPGAGPAVYAVLESGPKVYKSTDHGVTWTACTDPGSFAGGQGWYDLPIAQAPDGRVTLGGVSYPFNGGKGVLESVDGGTTWVAIDVGTNGVYPHTDHHAFLWVNGKLYNGNDGGLWRFTPVPATTQTFRAPATTTATGATRLATGSLNGDSFADVAITATGSDRVTVMLGSGAGTFGAPMFYTVGSGPVGVAIGDVNHDGINDVVTANKLGNSVSILLGIGNGSLQAPVDVPVDAGPVSVALADLNGDSLMDIVTANETANTVSLALQNADGTFQPAVNLPSDMKPSDVAVANLDDDAIPDIVSANANGGSVAVFTGAADGTYTKTSYIVGSTPLSVALSDVTGDQKPDIVVACQSSTWAAVLPNTGSGFGPIQRYTTDTNPSSVAVAEVTGDAYPDIITANRNGTNAGAANTVSIFPGTAAGGFGPRLDVPAGALPVSVAVGDFNNDAHTDIAVANSGTAVSVLIYDPSLSLGGGPGQWESLNTSGLGTIQIQGVALHPTSAAIALEGSQDNGTARRTGTLDWSTVSGGDGGIVRFDPHNGAYAYKVAPQGSFGTTQFFQLSANGGGSWSGRTNTISGDTTFPLEEDDGPMTPEELSEDTAFPFYPFFTVNPDDGTRLAIGSTVVYESKNRATTWTAISAKLAGGSQVSCLAYAPGYPDTLYAGFNNGGFYVTANDGALWTTRTHPWGGSRVSGIAVDPNDPNVVYVAISTDSAGRIWKSVNGGASWTSISGALPTVPAQSVVLDARTGTLFAGLDLGVWATQDSGATWIRFGDSLPNAQVLDLQLNTTTNLLAAGTHGRGAWVIGVLPGDINGDGVLNASDATLALGIWGGLSEATLEDAMRGNLVPASPGIQLDDVVAITRAAGGAA
jgi:hypothetical protein